MTILKFAVLACMTAALCVCWSAFSAAQEARRESFDFKEKELVSEDWHGIYLEGNHVGWRHVTVSRVTHNNVKSFLYEETEHLEFGPVTRDSEIKALYDQEYWPIAMLKTDQTGKIKSETYINAVYIAGAEGVKQLSEFQFNIKAGEALIFGRAPFSSEKPALFDFALPQYFRQLRRDNPEEAVELWALDTSVAAVRQMKLAAGKLEKVKIEGVETETRLVILPGRLYYFNRAFEPLMAVDVVRGLKFIRGAEGEAKSKDKKDPDYAADANLSDNVYADKKAGFSLRRPGEDWSLAVINRGPVTLLGMNGLLSDGKALSMTISGIPADTDIETAGAKLKRMITQQALTLLGWELTFDKEQPAEHREEHQRADSEAKATCGIMILTGKCSVILRGNVAMIILRMAPPDKREENDKLLDKTAESARLTPVEAAPVTYEDKKLGFRLTLPNALWTVEKTETGINLENSWLMARGEVIAVPAPQNTKLEDAAKQALQHVQDRRQLTQAGEHGGALDGAASKSYLLKGPLPLAWDIESRAVLLAALKDGYGYAFWVAMPADEYKKNTAPIDDLVKGFKFVKREPRG